VLAILYGPKGYIINSSINVEVIAALRAAVFLQRVRLPTGDARR
jgi:hypothetical protein